MNVADRFRGLMRGDGLAARALRSSAWRVGGYVLSQAIRLAANLLLARLLFPEAFGLMALVNILVQGLGMLSDIGIRPNIIQSRRGDEADFYNTAWTLQVAQGLVVWIFASLLALPFASFYEQPELAWLIPVAALATVIQAFSSTAIATTQRHLKLAKLTVLEWIAQLSGVSVMLVLAVVWPSVWALVLGSLASAVTSTALSNLWLADYRNRFRWDPGAARELIRFGKWILVSTALTFIASRSDRLLLGKLVSIETLGVYSLGYMLAILPKEIVMRLASAVLLPALSEHARNNRSRLREKVEESRRILLPPAMLMVLAIGLFGADFFRVLYDHRYHGAGWMAQLLCVTAWLQVLGESARRALVAIGRTWPQAAANSADLTFTLAGCIMGFAWFGISGLILGYAVGSAGKLVVIHVEMRRSGLLVVRQDLVYTTSLLSFAAIGGMDWHSVLTGQGMQWALFGTFWPSSAAAFAVCGLWVARELYRNLGRM